MRVCDTVGAEDGAFGFGVGEPCENDATCKFAMWHLCKECYKRLMLHRNGRGWGKLHGWGKESEEE